VYKGFQSSAFWGLKRKVWKFLSNFAGRRLGPRNLYLAVPSGMPHLDARLRSFIAGRTFPGVHYQSIKNKWLLGRIIHNNASPVNYKLPTKNTPRSFSITTAKTQIVINPTILDNPHHTLMPRCQPHLNYFA
jgi:hypothetical protein